MRMEVSESQHLLGEFPGLDISRLTKRVCVCLKYIPYQCRVPLSSDIGFDSQVYGLFEA